MAVVGHNKIEPITDRAENRQCSPSKELVSIDLFHGVPQRIHCSEDLAFRRDRMKNSANLDRVEVVSRDMRIVLSKINKQEPI